MSALFLTLLCIWRIFEERKHSIPLLESAFFTALVAYGIAVFRQDQISIYLTYFHLLAFLLLILSIFFRLIKSRRNYIPEPKRLAVSLVLLSISAGAILTQVSCYAGFARPLPLELNSPFKNGTFFVIQGGPISIINDHRLSGKATAQRFAVDISKIATFGGRATDIFSTSEPSDYFIFGEAVFSPCSGMVLFAQDGLDDQKIGSVDQTKPAGNYVAIGCNSGNTVVLAHLRKGLFTAAGAQVEVGQRLGLVGNSGNSTEPHLHLHAISGLATNELEALFVGNGIEVTINDVCLCRNAKLRLKE